MTSTNVNQAAFDKAAAHLLRQGSKSLLRPSASGTASERCAYRSPDGKMCAVGALIADEHYRDDLELRLASSPEVSAALAASGLEGVSLRLLSALQEVHDEVEAGEWRPALRDVAEEFELTPAVLDTKDPTYAL